MVDNTLLQLLLQVTITVTFSVVCIIVGRLLCQIFAIYEEDREGQAFYALLLGLLGVVSLYAVVMAQLQSVLIFALAAGIFLLRQRGPTNRPKIFSKISTRQFGELILLSIFFVLVFNYLPESEYKQKDSFFYLKISETLNSSGRENISNYYNALSKVYHGVEPYHYFECWLNAMLLRFTGEILPGIQLMRIVTYSIICIPVLYGFFYLYSLLAQQGHNGRISSELSPPLVHKTIQIGLKEKIACVAFLFFLPDIIGYLPQTAARFVVFNYESNLLERPNFRIIYLLLIAVSASVIKNEYSRKLLFFCVVLAIVSPTFLAVLVPAFVVLAIVRVEYRKTAFSFLVFLMAYALFYLLFAPAGNPSLHKISFTEIIHYFQRSYRFVALTMTTSLLYITLTLAAFIIIAALLFRRSVFTILRQHKLLLMFYGVLIVCGIITGRALNFLDNAYQVAFIGYISATFFIFAIFAGRLRQAWIIIFIFSSSSYVIFKVVDSQKSFVNVFVQNGNYSYDGTPYSQTYLEQVKNFCRGKRFLQGAFIADSAYYSKLYYSARNPNVYHLPITYIIANNVASNMDYCLSDTNAIKYSEAGHLQKNLYLNNAIARSYFQRTEFHSSIDSLQLDYFIITKHVDLPPIPIKTIFTDANTGEKFLIPAHRQK